MKIEAMTREYRTLDKTTWQRGEWDTEPDKIQWTDKDTRYPCLLVRNRELGNWCGYVGITEGHPLFNRDYEEAEIDIHGGLTFAGFCGHGDEATSICHVPDPGTPGRVFWLGFDCAHSGDLACFTRINRRSRYTPVGTYRNVAYVQNQCRMLAQQLKIIARTGR